jgi:sigma-B regulation protein RsbU (phosphoserine phosphatase)
VFEPMMRGGGATTSARSIGLGLFIVRKIAEAHGGTAHVTSTLESGTTFTVTFPRSPVANT